MTSRKMLHFSDVHFGVEHPEAVAAALAFAKDSAPDLVVISGDVTQKGHRREFRPFKAWMDALPQPVFLVPGNHDVPYYDLVARVFHPWRRFEEMTGHPAVDHELRAPGVMLRGINTARGWQARLNWSKGVIDLEQTRRAADALRSAPEGDLRVIVVHHPLVEMVGAPMTGEVKRGDAAAHIFAKAGVDLVMTGHVHAPFALPIGVGDNRSYGVGACTLSVRERGYKPGFNVIEWDADVIRVTAMGWVGDRFEPDRTWNLARRKSARRAIEAGATTEPAPIAG
jgi:3',5'-cyclic AMP phosphodiesterase CpdA